MSTAASLPAEDAALDRSPTPVGRSSRWRFGLRFIKFVGLRCLAFVLAIPTRWRIHRSAPHAGILLYHRIAPKSRGTTRPTWNVPPDRFRAQLRDLLRLGFEPWPLSRLTQVLAERDGLGDEAGTGHEDGTDGNAGGDSEGRTVRQRLPRRVFVVTFDDGYECVYRNAWPILRELRVPATIFLATAYPDGVAPLPFDDWSAKGTGEVPPDHWRPMTWQQCREMAQDPLIDFGSHTHTHVHCVGSPDRFADELARSREALRVQLGIADPIFAFPFGSHDDGMVEQVRESGAPCAVTSIPARVRVDSDLCHLGRFNVDEFETGRTLSLKLDGWFEWLRSVWGVGGDSVQGASRVPTAIIALLDQAFVSAAAFLTNVIVGNHSKSELGLYYIAYNLLVFLRGVQRQAISTPYTVFLHHVPDGARQTYSGSSFVQQLVMSVLSGCAPLGASAAAFVLGYESFVIPLLCVAMVAPFFLLREFLRQFAFAHLRFGAATVVDIIASFVQIAGLATLLVLGRLNLVTTYLLIGAISVAVSAAWGFSVFGELRFQKESMKPHWRRNWGFARWSLTCDSIGMVGPCFLPWVVAAVQGEETAGSLAAAATVVGVGQLFVTALANFLAPQAARSLARDGVDGLFRYLRIQFALFAVVLGGFGLGVVLVGRPLAIYLFGPSFGGLAPIQSALAIALFAGGLGNVAVIGLWVLHRPADNLAADATVLASIVVTAPWLLPIWGAFGAATSLAIGASAGLIVRLLSLRRARRLAIGYGTIHLRDKPVSTTAATNDSGARSG